jgi:hypothetical protein
VLTAASLVLATFGAATEGNPGPAAAGLSERAVVMTNVAVAAVGEISDRSMGGRAAELLDLSLPGTIWPVCSRTAGRRSGGGPTGKTKTGETGVMDEAVRRYRAARPD